MLIPGETRTGVLAKMIEIYELIGFKVGSRVHPMKIESIKVKNNPFWYII